MAASGPWDAVRRYAKSRVKAQGSAITDAYVPLFFAPGEACQFDWSHELVVSERRADDGEGRPFRCSIKLLDRPLCVRKDARRASETADP